MKKILLIGKNSNLCKAYVNKSKIKNFDVFSHNQINTINYSKYSHLINFSFNPKLLKTAYKKKFDIDFNRCIDNKKIEDYVLEDRIEGVKKFKINATPTIIINDKKFDKPLTFKNLKKFLEKLI